METDDLAFPDTDAIEEALAHLFAARDCLVPVALRRQRSEANTARMRLARQRARTHDAPPLLPTAEALDLAG